MQGAPVNSLKMNQRLAAARQREAIELRRARMTERPPVQGPCSACGNVGPRGIAPPHRNQHRPPSQLCPICADDATGYSAQHSLPTPTR